ncbi:hypothetical protein PVAND_016978 [Polypedilum vanderplanki]|uniref:Peptidase M14 domain-containing protein n=1 Tax=Polypedilum vanderplanki TaxID=319348 RepID=A0A9J6BHN0_POLVA|nr:hypothetical protein PVAND_016978 [Polypedilum vanderplanki]
MVLKILKFLFFLPLIFAFDVANYRNHKAIVLKIENENQFNLVKSLEFKQGYRFWISPVQVNMKVEMVVSPQTYLEFQELAEDNKIEYQVLTEDVQSWFDDEKATKTRKGSKDIENFALDQYNTFDEIMAFITEMQATHSEFSEIFTIGKSFEGREIKGIKISKNENNPAVFIEANIHAREWISSATAVWLINEFLTSTNETVREVVDGITWYIVPLLNADGYEYAYNYDRLWRKTRSTHASLLCYGADPNRNFGYHWMNGGASAVACTDTFAGKAPFSEPETKALMDFYATVYEKVKIFLSFHSATQALLYPWGDTLSPTQNVNDLRAIADAAINALTARHGTDYVFGNTVEVLYVASGTSPDYVYGVYNTSLAYTYEMRHANVGSRFVLPPEQIIPNAEEILESIMAMIAKAKELGYFKMSQLKTVSFIIFTFSLLNITKSINFHCTFFDERWTALGIVYSCEAEVKSVTKTKNLEVVVGNHQYNTEAERFLSNDDIKAISIREQRNLNYFPEGIDKFFRHVLAFDFEGCQISEVSSKDFAPFHNLKEISFVSNKITELPHNLFKNNPHLIKVDFEDNWIKHIGHEIFTHHKNLNQINLVDNVCISSRILRKSEKSQLIYDIMVNCPPSLKLLENEILDSERFKTEFLKIEEEKINQLKSQIEEIERKIREMIEE